MCRPLRVTQSQTGVTTSLVGCKQRARCGRCVVVDSSADTPSPRDSHSSDSSRGVKYNHSSAEVTVAAAAAAAMAAPTLVAERSSLLLHLQSSLPVCDLGLNSLAASVDTLGPQPFRMLNELLRERIVDHAWAHITTKALDALAAAGERSTAKGSGVEGDEPEEQEVKSPAAVQSLAASTAELHAATPSRVVAALFAPAAGQSSDSSSPSSLPGSCAALSLDGRLAIVGSAAPSSATM